jgi:hypothetical protein
MKRKVKRFDEGGETVDLRDNKDEPTGINDDVRARAKKFVETGKKDEEVATPTPKAKPKAAPKKEEPKSKPTLNFGEEKARLEKIDKPIERVYPEDNIPGVGMLKGLAKRAASTGMRDITPKSNVKQLEDKPTRQLGHDKKEPVVNTRESMDKKRADRAAARNEDMKKENAGRFGQAADETGTFSIEGLKKLRENIGGGKFKMASGGKVAGKLATRGYGISKHGKAK